MTETLSSPVPPGVDTEDFAFHPYPHSTKHTEPELDPFSSPPAPPLQDHNYNCSTTIYDESSGENTDEVGYVTEDEDGTLLRAAAGRDGGSSRSSISSFPGSIVPVHGYEPGRDGIEEDVRPQDTPTKSPKLLHHHRSGSLGYKIKSRSRSPDNINSGIARESGSREYSPAFRNPSSVRAMQMQDEEHFDDDFGGPRSLSGHRRRGSRMSVFSHRSGNSTQTSPIKRKSSPLKTSIKTEFPLVLLHCTLLPPTLGALTLPIAGQLSPADEEALLKEVLPGIYWRRWKLLKEKVERNIEVRTRGVLISHPRAEYDELEERLLESLELESARIREDHYSTTHEDTTDVEESEADEIAEITGLKTKCLDCGKKVSMGVEVARKWEVKVYAANGLMRAGAWGAAWGEMEKVDIEVGVWMPEDVRREAEERLAALGFGPREEDVNGDEDEDESRRREVYGTDEDEDDQEKIDGLFEDDAHREHPESHLHAHPTHHQQHQIRETSFQDLVFNCLRVLAQDRRNVLIAFLSILVLFYAISTGGTMSEEISESLAAGTTGTDAPKLEFVTMTVTSTTVAVSTTTLVESAQIITPESAQSTEATENMPAESTEDKLEDSREPRVETPMEQEAREAATEEEQQAPSVAEIVVDMLVGDGDTLLE